MLPQGERQAVEAEKASLRSTWCSAGIANGVAGLGRSDPCAARTSLAGSNRSPAIMIVTGPVRTGVISNCRGQYKSQESVQRRRAGQGGRGHRLFRLTDERRLFEAPKADVRFRGTVNLIVRKLQAHR